MPTEPTGPPVDEGEEAIRAILYPAQWADGRPSSGFFREQCFSVDLASLTTAAAVRARFNQVFGLVKFDCGRARQLNFHTHHEPEHGNDAHAHVYFHDEKDGWTKPSKTSARKLAEICSLVPPDED